MGIGYLVAQKLQTIHSQGLCLLRFCAAFGWKMRELLSRAGKNQYVHLDSSVQKIEQSQRRVFCVLNGRYSKGTRQSSFFEITNMIHLEHHQHSEDFEGRIIFHVRAQRRRLDNEK